MEKVFKQYNFYRTKERLRKRNMILVSYKGGGRLSGTKEDEVRIQSFQRIVHWHTTNMFNSHLPPYFC